jgi:hypothetical protein
MNDYPLAVYRLSVQHGQIVCFVIKVSVTCVPRCFERSQLPLSVAAVLSGTLRLLLGCMSPTCCMLCVETCFKPTHLPTCCLQGSF